MNSNKLYEEKVITTSTSKMHLIKIEGNWKLHRWDGPAVEPINENTKGKQYFLYGRELTLKEYKSALKSREGLPWYKSSGTKARS